MFSVFKLHVQDWPSLARYAYFLLSNIKLMRYSEWCAAGEPNPFVRRSPRDRQTDKQEIADIFAMTSQELAEFGRTQRVEPRRRAA